MSSFKELGLEDAIVQAVEELGFTEPTPIQEQAIPQLLADKRDLLGLAQTGTGKTAAFGLPLVNVISKENRATQGLVIAPTRELANQIAKDLMAFAKYKFLRVVVVYGGASIQSQIQELRRGAQIIIATPGRLIDLIDRGEVRLGEVTNVVLDEADEMLNMGFITDIDKILDLTPAEKNTWLFSATMPKEIRGMASKYMTDPIEIKVGEANSTNVNIEHHYYAVKGRDKYVALKRIVDYYPGIFGIIFCRTKSETQRIADNLCKDGYSADALHGDLSQAQRDRVMKNYKNKNLQLLVATDVAARGIDVDNVTHVVQYGLPDDIESYTHRSGRTARAGKKGISLAIIDNRDLSKIRMIERKINDKFQRQEVPTGEEVCKRQLGKSLDKIKDVEVNEEKIQQYLPIIEEAFAELSKEDIIKKIASAEVNRFLSYYTQAPDLNVKDSEISRGMKEPYEGGGNPRSRRSSNEDRIFINMGRADGMKRKDILNLVVSATGIESRYIGDIDDKGAFSFFQVDKNETDKVITAFRNFEHNGKELRVEVTKSEPKRAGSGPRGRTNDRRGGTGGGFRNDRTSDRGGDRDRRSGGSREGGNREGGFRGSRDRDDRGGERSRDRGDRGDRSASRPARNTESKPENKEGNEGGKNLSDLFSEPSNYF